MRASVRVATGIAAVLLASTSPLIAQGRSVSPTRIDALFADDGPGAPGATVVVVQDGEVLYKQSYGLANLEYQIPITSSTPFDIASFSKQFAGMAVAMLVEDGTISLDEEIRTYLPEVPDFGTPVTVRHLVHHISGIRDWPATLALAGWQMDDVISFEQIMTMVQHQQELNFPPGTEYSYSNTGYNLLAELVSRVSGLSFREWTDANIFRPLGMGDTHFHDDHQEIVPNRARGYSRWGDGYREFHNGLTALGSSSLFTTIDDLVKWAANFDDPRVGGSAVINRMHEPGQLNDDSPVQYAFGLGFGESRGLRTSSHGGSWANFRTHFLRFPDQKFTVMVLSNLGSFNPSLRCNQIADMYLGHLMNPIEPSSESSTGSVERPESSVDQAPRVQQFELSTQQLQEYVGRYYSEELGTAYDVVLQDGRLVATHRRHDDIALIPTVADEFRAGSWFTRVATFQRDRSGTITGFRTGEGRARNLWFARQD